MYIVLKKEEKNLISSFFIEGRLKDGEFVA